MKRRDLIRELNKIGCVLIRHGARHDWYQNPQTKVSQPVPRHREVNEPFAKKAKRRLEFLHSAVNLEDMYFPPSNRFHALEGFTPTQYAIWVDQRWRITFEWREGNAYEVLFEDYHR